MPRKGLGTCRLEFIGKHHTEAEHEKDREKMRNSKHDLEQYPDHSDELNRLRKIMGQLAGIERMITAHRHRPEVIQQIRAATSAMKALEISIIKNHMSTCIRKSARSDTHGVFDQKLNELMEMIKA